MKNDELTQIKTTQIKRKSTNDDVTVDMHTRCVFFKSYSYYFHVNRIVFDKKVFIIFTDEKDQIIITNVNFVPIEKEDNNEKLNKCVYFFFTQQVKLPITTNTHTYIYVDDNVHLITDQTFLYDVSPAVGNNVRQLYLQYKNDELVEIKRCIVKFNC